jgi:undecaprenyl-diphosphatase
MKKKTKVRFTFAGVLFLLFVLFTLLVTFVDVKPIGPQQSEVGLAAVNCFVFKLFGVHLVWYHITDWLGVVAILIAFSFGALGLYQLIVRRGLKKVDSSILVLGAFYILVIACYVFFEYVIVNYRPVILEPGLEASYPSSHTMIVVCIMGTAPLQLRRLCPRRKNLCLGMDVAAILISAVTVIGRLISGVHWFTDVVGGLLLSSALVALYCAVARSNS